MEAISNINFKGNVQKSYVSSDITDYTLLNKAEADVLYKANDYTYDWTPSDELQIQFTMTSGSTYTAPCNGWLIKNPESSDSNGYSWSISVNGNTLLTSDNEGQISAQLILGKDDVVTSTTSSSRNCLFIPCRSEEADYREDNLRAAHDIWKGAVVLENGNYVVRDQYIPDASVWNSEHKETFVNQLNHVHNGEGHNGECGHLFYIQSENIEKANGLFSGMLLSYIDDDFPILKSGKEMCKSARNLHTFTGGLNSLEDGNQMFSGCSALTTFNSNLNALINGPQMFLDTGFTTFTTYLPELINSNQMFDGSELTSWTVDMPKLKSGSTMFRNNPITSFRGNTPKLQTGESMFSGCTNLTSWEGDLSSLMTGYNMFYNTKLNATSVSNIADAIKDISGIDKNTLSNWNITTSYNYDTKTENVTNISQSQRGRIDIYVDSNIISDEGVVNSCERITGKGWNVYLNGSLMQFFVLTSDYDTGWSASNNIDSLNNSSAQKITKIIDSVIYNGDEMLCNMPTPTGDIVDVSGGNGLGMFYTTELAEFRSDLSSLMNGSYMFRASKLGNINEMNCPELVVGEGMFENTPLTRVECAKFPRLTNGFSMFCGGWVGLYNNPNYTEYVDCDFPLLSYGRDMFMSIGQGDNSPKLKSFRGNLSNLQDGRQMFWHQANLKEFVSDLGSLVTGADMMASSVDPTSHANIMFCNCYLNLASLKNIADNIRDISMFDWMSDTESAWRVSYYQTAASSSSYTIPLNSRGYLCLCYESGIAADEINSIVKRLYRKGWRAYMYGRYSHSFTAYPSSTNLPTNYKTTNLANKYPALNPWYDKYDQSWGQNYYSYASATNSSSSSTIHRVLDNCFILGKNDSLYSYQRLSQISGWTENDDAYLYLETSYTASIIKKSYPLLSETISVYNPYSTGSGMFAGTGLCLFTSNLSKLTNGYMMFANCDVLYNVKTSLPNLKYGSAMFKNCSSLHYLRVADMGNLISGQDMFNGCLNLQSINSQHYEVVRENGGTRNYNYYRCANLSSLVDGTNMFNNCTSFYAMIANCGSLVCGDGMFSRCTWLEKVQFIKECFYGSTTLTHYNKDKTLMFSRILSELPYMTTASGMFENCTNVSTFYCNMPSLINGKNMFNGCTKLSHFYGDLSSLKCGYNMFKGCKLSNGEGVKIIAEKINDISKLDKNNKSDWYYPYQQCQFETITNTSGHIDETYRGVLTLGLSSDVSNYEEALQQIVAKGWTVYINDTEYAVSASELSASVSDETESTTPTVYYYKPVEVDEENANYVDANGKYYVLLGGQYVYGDDLSNYGMFTSRLNAVEMIGLTEI